MDHLAGDITGGRKECNRVGNIVYGPESRQGIAFFISSFTLSDSTSVIAVVMKPGATAFEVIPLPAYSLAIVLVNPIIPAFEAL